MGLFSKLVEGLTKTRDNIVSGIDSVFSGFSEIDDDFYDELEEIMVNDKLYKVIRAEDTVTMLYKVDTSFYIRIELFGAVQFDSSGNHTEVTCSPSDYLDNGWLDKEIVINITPVE